MSRPSSRAAHLALPGARSCPQAFTLIELLVVVGVIGILASLLMPTLLRAMGAVSATRCKSNLGQLGGAMTGYCGQSGGYIVPAGNPPGTTPHFDYWYNTLLPFGGDPGVWRCPAKLAAAVGYGQNYHCFSGPAGGASLYQNPQRLDLVENPTGTVIFCDTGYVFPNGGNPDGPPEEWSEALGSADEGCCRFPMDNAPGGAKTYTAWNTDPWRPFPRHPAFTVTCLFFDGHTESLNIHKLVDYNYGDKGCLYDNQ